MPGLFAYKNVRVSCGNWMLAPNFCSLLYVLSYSFPGVSDVCTSCSWTSISQQPLQSFSAPSFRSSCPSFGTHEALATVNGKDTKLLVWIRNDRKKARNLSLSRLAITILNLTWADNILKVSHKDKNYEFIIIIFKWLERKMILKSAVNNNFNFKS